MSKVGDKYRWFNNRLSSNVRVNSRYLELSETFPIAF